MKKYLPARLRHSLSLFVFLFTIWIVFSGHLEPFFLIAGALSCALVVYLAQRMDVMDHEGHPIHMARQPFSFWFWLAGKMIKSSLEVTRLMWQRNPKISPTLAWIPARQDSDLGRVTYANSITLTPGTVCIDVEPERMLVHALQEKSIDELLEGEMELRVRGMMVVIELPPEP